MKNIIIQNINLINFKGIRNQKIDFDKNTNIYGDNGTGKTTIFDAFTWAMFGKDSTDRKDFQIKTLDKDNVVIPQIEHEVGVSLIVDGEEVTIKRILKENWVKKRGSLETEFTGNGTDYYWNEVPMQQKEFQQKVSQILDETVFKLITNPLAFNSLKWQERRNALIQIVGEVSDSELASGNSEYENLIAQLTNGKTLEDYRKQIAASIKKAKDDLKAIPIRVDEISRSKPETFDFLKLSVDLEKTQAELGIVDDEIANSNLAFQSKLDAQKMKRVQANNLKTDIQIIEDTARREAIQKTTADSTFLDNLKAKLKTAEDNLETKNIGFDTLNAKIVSLENQITDVNSKIESKRKEWATENESELSFNENSFCCPTCKRDFEANDIETKKTSLLLNFRSAKDHKLIEIRKQGTALGEEKGNLEKEIEALKVRIENGKHHINANKIDVSGLKTEIETEIEKSKSGSFDKIQENLVYESILSINLDYKLMKTDLLTLEATIEEIPVVDNSELVEKRKCLVSEIDDIKSKLQNEININLIAKRIEDLHKEQKALAQQIASVEKTQFVIENFNKLKIVALEQRINSKFTLVNFKMFETQINGGEVECCDCLIDGVPFSDVNTAGKINAGLDIVNTLCGYYRVTAPIFIDNRESIVSLIPSESQIVNLIVSGEDKRLRVA